MCTFKYNIQYKCIKISNKYIYNIVLTDNQYDTNI